MKPSMYVVQRFLISIWILILHREH